jgi:VCBS repeat-containing protein
MNRQLTLALWALILFIGFDHVFANPVVSNITLVGGKRHISKRIFEYTYRATITNDTSPRNNVTATLVGAGSGTTILEGNITVGTLAPNQVVTPSDTFKIQHNKQFPFDPNSLIWNFTGDTNILPTANPDNNSATEGGAAVNGNVLTNDQPGNAPATVTAADQNGTAITLGAAFTTSGGGSLTLNADGSYSYTPPAQGTVPAAGLTETFSYTMTDADGDPSNSTLAIAVAQADLLPTANPDNNSATEGGAAVNGNVLTNDQPGNAPATVTAADQSGTAITLGAAFTTSGGGSLTLNADGSYSYTPPAQGTVSASGLTETFSYSLADADGDPSSSTLTLSVKDAVSLPLGGILLPGDPNAQALEAMPDYDAKYEFGVENIETGPEGGVFARTVLFASINPEATVGAVNALLESVNARIIQSQKGVAAITLSIPDPGSLSGTFSIVAALEANPAISFAFVHQLPETEALPDADSKATSTHPFDTISHHLAVNASAAWNARNALNYTNSKAPELWIYDGFGMGAINNDQVINDSNSSHITNYLGKNLLLDGCLQSIGSHGYHVTGIFAGSFSSAGSLSTDRQLVTGMFPGNNPIPGRFFDIIEDLIATQQSIPASPCYSAFPEIPKIKINNFAVELASALKNGKHIVLNTSVGYKGGFKAKDDSCNQFCVAAEKAQWWLQSAFLRIYDKTKGQWLSENTEIEKNLVHIAAAGNDDKAPAKFSSEWNAATLLSAAELAINGNDVPPLKNTLVVENRTVQDSNLPEPGSLHETSSIGGQVSAIGSVLDNPGQGVYSLTTADSADGVDYKYGTSMASPQVAGLAAYLWALNPDLTSEQVVNRIKFNTAKATDEWAPSIDAYAAILSADDAIALQSVNDRFKAPVRIAIFDLDNDQDFDKDDLAVWVDKLKTPSAEKDYSRWDLNGDGYTGGDGKAPFNLNIDYSDPTTGKHVYGQIKQPTFYDVDVKVDFDENNLKDKEILCYYANSSLYQGDKDTLAATLGTFCGANLEVELQVSDTVAGWNGLPATIKLTNLTTTAPNGLPYTPNWFAVYGTGNTGCPDGERGGPIFSSVVDADSAFYAAKSASGVPYTTFFPNRPPCSSFVAYKGLNDPATEEVWINGTQRAYSISGFNTIDWEYQVRFYTGDPANSFAGKQCQVGTVPNSGNWALGFNAAQCSYKIRNVITP